MSGIHAHGVDPIHTRHGQQDFQKLELMRQIQYLKALIASGSQNRDSEMNIREEVGRLEDQLNKATDEKRLFGPGELGRSKEGMQLSSSD